MRSLIKDISILAKEEARILVGQYEMSVGLFRSKRPQVTISPATEIVIEGAPSSGNSFATEAFKLAQERNVVMAHHQHLPFQVTLACRSNIPCLVLIRDPLDAVVSRVSRYGYYKPQTFEASLWMDYSMRHWIMFYQRILGVLPDCVVCDFRELISDYPAVIQRVNSKFGTDHRLPTEEMRKQALGSLVEGVKPDKERELRKSEFKELLRREEKFQKKLGIARELYKVVLSRP